MRIRRDVLLAAGVLAFVPLSTGGPPKPRVVDRGSPTQAYSKGLQEAYLTQEQLDYVRPGFNIKVNSIKIPDDRRPVVDLSFTDDKGQPLDRLGNVTPGPLSLSQVLAWWDAGTRYYTAYTTRVQTSPITKVSATQAAADSGGTWTDLAVGHSTYRFKTALPAGYDGSKTHTLAIYATRNLVNEGIAAKNYYDNVVYDFRPDGGTVTEFWDKTVNGNCNECHNPLAAHGGSRQDVKLCVTCHSPQTTDPDTGHTVNFREMIHKIHRGENLPSVEAGTPYQIIGNQQSVNDYSTVAFPKDIRNCQTCHKKGATPAEGGTQFANYFTYPARTPCGACHDDIDWASGKNHPGGAQADDSQCASCHQPEGDSEWDASVLGAHTVPFKSKQLKGVKAQIVSVTNTAPGQKPTVLFTITRNDGTPIPPSAFTVVNTNGTTSSGLNLIMSGPTTDYSVPPQIRERADGATTSGSNDSYTFKAAIPADSTGTWAFSIEARLVVTLNPAPKDTATVRDAAFNPVFYAPVTDTVAVPRRVVVDIAKCNVCHDRLALHGSNRLNPQECVFCHNPNGNDGREVPESIDFKRMIHRIHTGAELTHDYSIGDDGSFNGVRFPGDRRDCEKCHATDTQQVLEDPPEGLLATPTPRDWYTPMQHFATACLGCHDSKPAAAHAYAMTAPFGESCAACHGPDADFAVDKVHAR